ncbi:MAG: S1C family serine protease [Cyanobacteria bacterium REEB67]|nr:S1C family serine protease [Cyanobacteria bacterium REEB67]
MGILPLITMICLIFVVRLAFQNVQAPLIWNRQQRAPGHMLDSTGLDQFVSRAKDPAQNDTPAQKLYLEASLLGAGLAQGIAEKGSELLQHPLSTAASLGATTALTYGAGWAAMRYAPAAFGVGKLVIGAAMAYEAGSAIFSSAEAGVKTWNDPSTLKENQKVIADRVGKPLTELALYSLAGAGGLWRGAGSGKAAAEIAGSLELQATRRSSATHLPVLLDSPNQSIKQLRLGKDAILSEVYAKASPSVVQIFHGPDPFGHSKGSYATGFLVDDGLVATNNHVLHGHSVPTIKLSTGEWVEAKLVARDKTADLALLRLPQGTPSQPPLTLGNSDSIGERTRVLMLGHPFAVSRPVISDGYVTARQGQKFIHHGKGVLDPFPTSESFFENVSVKGSPGIRDVWRPNAPAQVIRREVLAHNAPTQPGSSGSPLLDRNGQVIGVHSIGGEFKWGSTVEHLKALIKVYKETPPCENWLRVITHARAEQATLGTTRGFAYTRLRTEQVEIADLKAIGARPKT